VVDNFCLKADLLEVEEISMSKHVKTQGFFEYAEELLENHNSTLEKESSITDGTEADLIAEANPSKKIKDASVNSAQLHLWINRKAKRIHLLRFLCGKVAFQVRLTVEDLFALYQALLDVEDLVKMDPNLKKKYAADLESLAIILKGFRFTTLDPKGLKGLSKQLMDLDHFILPKRNLAHSEKHLDQMYRLTGFRKTGTPKSMLPPKLYVGVGYSDKGTARDPAFDGSPSWQEVAMTRGTLL
jgi:hypothetical protein